jgi:hypothetical protein
MRVLTGAELIAAKSVMMHDEREENKRTNALRTRVLYSCTFGTAPKQHTLGLSLLLSIMYPLPFYSEQAPASC